jgi:hypothetical protein
MRGCFPRRANGLAAWVLIALLTACAGWEPELPSADPAVKAIEGSAWARQSRIGFAAEGKSWQHKTFGDRKPTVREARERTGNGTADRPKVRSRRELEGALGAVRKGGVPARVLAWVLGQSDDAEWMEG